MEPTQQVIVIGAGAAGLLAATRAAERGRNTLLLEKNRKPGAKILMSGGSRCNITHDCDAAGIIAAFGPGGKFLYSALAALPPRELIELLHNEGLATKVEPGGKVFPATDRAADVLHALLRRLQRSCATLALDERVREIIRGPHGFVVVTNHCERPCEKLIVTTGGKSYPRCGTTGDGYAWLARLGHTIRPPRPALVPLVCEEPWAQALSGLTLGDVCVRVRDRAETSAATTRRRRGGLPPGVLIERRGSLLFTHFGFSGPAALDVSRAVSALPEPQQAVLEIDFLPTITVEELEHRIRTFAAREGKRAILGLVAELLPRRLAESLLRQANVPFDQRLAELSSPQRSRIVETLKACAMPIAGTRGFDKAEVTAGGVSLDEVDSRSMESKLVPGLYLAGEILDLDGFIGGYNFQAAFSTGWLAGEHA
ncbi:MAG: NAD(P)/FAD-dependent oxidoreductase [Pirellulales bacterium]|nr:NAD(P)/FAD-dependent oxidoreductase [Pirellulales bacterium]